VNYDSFNAACLNTFSEPVSFIKTSGNVALQAVFDRQLPTETIGGAVFIDNAYILTLPSAAISANAIGLRDTVSVRGLAYQILDIIDDTGGLSVLKIKRKKP
jgi:hypothetical protein